MVGARETDFGDKEQLTTVVYEELTALRGAHGKLTAEKFSRYPTLHLVCGGGDGLDAFLVFERQLQRYIRQGNRNEVAAALSIAADADLVINRNLEVLAHFELPSGEERSERTARRWSDQGMHSVATDLVHLGDVQQRLGSELLTIELAGTREGGISLVIWQLTTRHRERAPLVRLWHYPRDDAGDRDTTTTYDLDQVESLEGSKGPFRLRGYTFKLEIPKNLTIARVNAGDTIYRISIEGRDAPLRAVSFQDDSALGEFFAIRFSAYLTDATIEVIKRPPES